ncbi:hypothetical protein JCM5296_001325 [Sporobolomyces johnsonii]
MTMPAVPPHPALLELLPTALRDHHQPLRVTTQAKMLNLIAFALSHLREPESSPLVLHCLPPPPSSSSAAGPSTSTQPDSAAPTPKASSSSPASSKSTDALPKLVSVVEIIKREYASLLAPSPDSSDKGKGKELPTDPAAPLPAPRELHQYTLLTTLEVLRLAGPSPKEQEDEEMERTRQELIALEWLTGKAGKGKRPRRKHTPCMVVVLSLQPLDALVRSKGFSYQAPVPPPKPKPSATKHARDDGGESADDGAKKKPRRRKRTRAKKVAGEDDVADMSVDLAEGVAARGGGE